jgi:hypothetical protein
LIAVFLSAPGATAQHQNHGTIDRRAAPGAAKPIVVADGALTPDLVPDDIAYLHFFRVLAANPASKDYSAEERRRQSYIRHFFTSGCGFEGKEDRSLTQVQIQRLLGLVDRTAPKLEALNAQLAVSRNEAEYGTGKRLVLKAVMDAVSESPDSVDRDAAVRIAAHVLDRVKKNTRIVSTVIPGKVQ